MGFKEKSEQYFWVTAIEVTSIIANSKCYSRGWILYMLRYLKLYITAKFKLFLFPSFFFLFELYIFKSKSSSLPLPFALWLVHKYIGYVYHRLRISLRIHY